MHWSLVLLAAILAYVAVAWVIRSRGLFSRYVMWYGPVLALKTDRVGFFDRFRQWSAAFRIYGSLGALAVIIVSVTITLLLVLAVHFTLLVQPEPTGIYKPQNIFLIPGINEYVPSTFAVWAAFILAIAVHEFGHAVLCRVESIGVRSVGALIAVIPIGFFVEPDETELENTKGMPKIRMFGAGITNNLLVGGLCFLLLIGVAGMAVPVSQPVIAGVYKDYPASLAGIPAGSLLQAVDGTAVADRAGVSELLNATRPGEMHTFTVESGGVSRDYTVTLAAWPAELGAHSGGFLGISYYDGAIVLSAMKGLVSPLGLIQFISIPFDPGTGGQLLRVLAFETPETQFYTEPFPLFWGIVHLLFWSAWININVGIFNAIPMVPLDGGYIMKEGVDRLLSRRGLSRFGPPLVSAVSSVMLVMLVSLVLLPYILHI